MTPAKKIFIGSATLFLALLLFWGIYNLSFKKSPVETLAEAGKELLGTAKESATDKSKQAKIAPISQEGVLAPFLEEGGNAIKYYSRTNGKVYEIDLSGNPLQTIATRELPGLMDVFWSPNGKRVVSKFSRPGNQLQFFFYDYEKSQGTPLKSNLDTVTWQNNSRIFYKYFDPKSKSRTLNVSDPDGSNWTKIVDLDYKFVSVSPVPKSGLVSFWNRADAFSPTVFQTTPTIGGERKTVFKDKFGADYLWSPSGNNVLISHSGDKGGADIQLAVINDRGGEYRNLDVPTFTSKCTWSKDGKHAYCALPGSIPNGAVLPNDYNEGKFHTADTFWKINTATGEKERVIDPEQIKDKYDSSSLFLNLDESLLFFINKLDGKLYKMTL